MSLFLIIRSQITQSISSLSKKVFSLPSSVRTKTQLVQPALSLRWNAVRFNHNPKQTMPQYLDDVNAEIPKDIVLFRYENAKLYRLLNIFGFAQFLFWCYLSSFVFSNIKNVPVDNNDEKSNEDEKVDGEQKITDEQLPWWRKINLGDSKYRTTLSTTCFLMGWGIIALTWMYTLRSVRYIVLRKGGEQVSVVTYTPVGGNRITTVDIKNVSAAAARDTQKTLLPFKIKNHWLFYVLDMRGEFIRPKMFDHTVGVAREFTNK